MNPNDHNIKITLSCDGHFLAVSTYSRLHGRHGRFLFGMDWIRKVLGQSGTFYDCDCGNHASVRRSEDDGLLHITFDWLTRHGDDRLDGVRQSVEIPAESIERLLERGGTKKLLYRLPQSKARIDASRAGKTIRHIRQDKLRRSAFRRAMRDCFQWPGDVVTLYSDGEQDFYFTTQSGYPRCGGLILTDTRHWPSPGKRPRCEYSVHT